MGACRKISETCVILHSENVCPLVVEKKGTPRPAPIMDFRFSGPRRFPVDDSGSTPYKTR